jgi:hypothetical protein
MSFAAPIANYTDNLGSIISSGQYATPQLFDLNNDGLLDLIVGKKTGELLYYQNNGTTTSPSFQLKNDLLGNIDIATTSPDGFPTPHFFRHNDTTYLFLGGIDGQLHYYNNIDGNLAIGSSFNLHSDNFLDIDAGAYSSFWVNDIDQDGFLNLFVGQDLGGLYHFEVDPNSQSSISEIENTIELIIYPNPTNGIFTLSSSDQGTLSFKVVDLFGKTVIPQKDFEGTITVDLQQHSAGMYLVIVSNTDGDQLVKRLLKE